MPDEELDLMVETDREPVPEYVSAAEELRDAAEMAYVNSELALALIELLGM